MPEIKQQTKETNKVSVLEQLIDQERTIADMGTANLLVSLLKKVHGLPVNSRISSAVASQLASEVDAELLRAKGLGEVQIQLLRKLPLVIRSRNQGHYNAFQLHEYAVALLGMAEEEEYYATLITRLNPIAQIVCGKGIQELAENKPRLWWGEAADGSV